MRSKIDSKDSPQPVTSLGLNRVRVVVTLVIALAIMTCAVVFAPQDSNVKAKEAARAEAGSPKLSGEEAINYLKATGDFDSLMREVGGPLGGAKWFTAEPPAAEVRASATESSTLNASDGADGDRFGVSVAIWGNTAVIGAMGDDVGSNGSQGSAYVFVRSDSTWTQQAKLVASDGAAVDLFGSSVAIYENTAIVGAQNDDIGTRTNQGSAYVFARSGTVWTQQAKLVATDGQGGDTAGKEVGIYGDTVILGAHNHNNTATDQGAAYVFVRSGTTWTQQAKLSASDSLTDDNFGWDVGIWENTAVISAPFDDIDGNNDQGSAYVFVRSGSAWTQQAKLIYSDFNGVPDDHFGYSVAVSGNTAVIGTPLDNIRPGIDQGSAYVFARSGTVWTEQAKLVPSEAAEVDQFGRSIDLFENTLVVTTARETVWVFHRTGSAWTEQRKLTSSDGEVGDNFGAAAAVSGDTVLVGAEANFVSGVRTGSAYAYPASTAPAQVRISGRITNGGGPLCGVQVALSGGSSTSTQTDANGDYFFSNLTPGNSYTVTPSLAGHSFIPADYVFNNLTANQAADFTTTQLPAVSGVQRTYPGFFLRNPDNIQNTFTVGVNWSGSPGRVRFQVNNDAPFEIQGDANGAVQTFNLTTSFPTSFSPSIIRITPINGEGVVGVTRTEEVYVFPYPAWLEFAVGLNESAVSFSTQPGEVRANFDVAFPREPLRALVAVPTSVPFIGGQFGVRETQVRVNGFASSAGSGTLTIAGGTGLVGMGREIDGNVSGSGDFLLNQNGLSMTGASFNPSLSGTMWREGRLIDVLPFLNRFSRFPAVLRFAEAAKLRGEVRASFDIGLSWRQDSVTGDFAFNEGTGQIGFDMKGVLSTRIKDRIEFQAWVAGGGSMTVGVPAPYARGLEWHFEPGAQLTFDHLFGGPSFRVGYAHRCTWTPADGEVNCTGSDSSSNSSKAGGPFNPKLELLRPRYERFGRYESFRPRVKAAARAGSDAPASAAPASEETVVGNVFAGARPTILTAGSGGRVLLWVRQNTSLPVLQSTEIAWSYDGGTGWNTPAVIASDTRAEFSPVAGVDAGGRVVAAWLKIKNPSFDTPTPTFNELPLYYKEVEVVSAIFDPATRTWGAETSLTDDAALDTSLRLAGDDEGNLLLTWQSNPSGEFTADAEHPAVLKYSFWNGSSWNAPAAVASNLSNVSDHAAALDGDDAFVVLPEDPDANATNDGRLLVYRWSGMGWSQATVFAGGGVDNRLPAAAYDAEGAGRVVWLRGANLVHATLGDGTPQTAREGSESTAFHDVRLINNAAGNLTLIWQEVVDSGPANIFAKIYYPVANAWGDDRRLNQDARESKDAAGYYDGAGNLQLAYLATQILRVTKTVTIEGQSYEIPNVPENGQTDLNVLTVNRPVTAELVTVSGRVTTADGAGIPKARVTLRSSVGDSRTATTDAEGHYRFHGVAVGDNYILSLDVKGFTFAKPSRSLFVLRATDGVVFAALPARIERQPFIPKVKSRF